MRAHTVRFFYDQLFVKEAGSPVPTSWHHDITFWPLAGQHICSLWLPLDPGNRTSSGLEYVRGSHRWSQRFKAIDGGEESGENVVAIRTRRSVGGDSSTACNHTRDVLESSHFVAAYRGRKIHAGWFL